MGYDPDFITGFTIGLPRLGERQLRDAWADGEPLEHSRFSVLFNQQRGLAFLTAHNVDGAAVIPEGTIERRNWFEHDPMLPSGLQIDNNRGYRNNPWDRGHLVRRRSLHWGDESDARLADRESFFWTNIAPQHERLHSSAWGKIENWMFERTEDTQQRACVFQGPVFTDVDPLYQNTPEEVPIRIPAGYWKVIALPHQGRLVAAAFLVWQRDYDQDSPVDFDPVLEQVRITTLEYLTGLGFDDIRHADALRAGQPTTQRRSRRVTDAADDTAMVARRTSTSRFVSDIGDIMMP